ncbi:MULTISPECIES: hypothetical protein [Frankia]|uniref:hypothetical protein n=1 Tax=Frankia TaxID=1854 RepID=UPI000AE73F62|nr:MULTISPECIES: hypothetical protein [Frankia]
MPSRTSGTSSESAPRRHRGVDLAGGGIGVAGIGVAGIGVAGIVGDGTWRGRERLRPGT